MKYTLAKAEYLRGLCDGIGKAAIDEAIELYKDYDISISEFNYEIQTAFYGSITREFRKKYEEIQKG